MAGMNCPESERIAAYVDGRLDAAEEALLLEHGAECDDCRRELALVGRFPREAPAPLPDGLRARTLKAIARAGDRTPRPSRHLVFERRPRHGHVAAAAAVLVAAGLLAIFTLRSRPVPPVRDAVVRPPVERPETPPLPDPRPEIPAPPPRPRDKAPEPRLAADPPRPVPAPLQDLVPEPLPDPIVVEPESRPGETRPVVAIRPPSHTIAERALSELQITDAVGLLSVRRKSGKVEKVAGVATLGEGDVLTAEKPSSFHVDGRHPVVLGESASLSLAYAAQEEAPYLHLRAGEAMVDSTGPTRWVVTDGRVAAVVKHARARFSVVPGTDRLSVAALTEPLFIQPDGGEVHAVRPGQELRVARASAEIAALDPALASKKAAAFEAARPRQRTLFYTSCDPADAKREHFFVQEGGWFRNEALLSAVRDRTAAVALSPNPRFAWRPNLVLRCRLRTNATQLQVALRVEERKYILFKVLTFDRKSANQWIPVEIPIVPSQLQFRRDDGGNQLLVTGEDRFESIRFSAQQQDVFGDQRVTFLVDDLQVVEKE